jgi:hypothetical protein
LSAASGGITFAGIGGLLSPAANTVLASSNESKETAPKNLIALRREFIFIPLAPLILISFYIKKYEKTTRRWLLLI